MSHDEMVAAEIAKLGEKINGKPLEYRTKVEMYLMGVIDGLELFKEVKKNEEPV